MQWKNKYEQMQIQYDDSKVENNKLTSSLSQCKDENNELKNALNNALTANQQKVDKIDKLESICHRQEVMIQMLQKGGKIISGASLNSINISNNDRIPLREDLENRMKINGRISPQRDSFPPSNYKQKADTLKNQIKGLDDEINGLKKNLMTVLSNYK